LKNRRVRFTATAQEHVRREKAWWLANRDHPDVFTEELEQALQIAAVRDWIREMLSPVNLNDNSRICAQEIYFHSSPTVECNGQVGVHLESSSCLRQSFQASIEKCLGCAPRALDAFDFRRNRTSSRHEQGRQRRINPIAN
jgi:hypothetical protein